ncbi:hypothetical protein FD06_GL000304 [Apilactobacillus ozensis DSM 23829 = JCM 17196]|uniref:Uncharacterized protein n=1 Tax=Apilactobacillus ozensis DSM 23829 = JCM 17196 TaxID=1423781 RepID=A0A0R2AQL7_9LACO|nr:hypothetical protein [Apilactobacillus ozensis]KRM69245.1 hypothetical protein FD06_GL000304 [Apilactobacillus ozensis DSM 23829 = JCM 17196]
MNLQNIKHLIASEFGYKQFYDEFNTYRLIRPKNSVKELDKFLNPYVDRVVLNHQEAFKLFKILYKSSLKDNPDLRELISRLYIASANQRLLKIDNFKEDLVSAY